MKDIQQHSKDTIATIDHGRDTTLWHRRLGHMSEKGMKLLASKEKLPNLKHIELGLCEDCIYGKQKRVSFSKAGWTPKKEKLELVHTDVWGPAPKAKVENQTSLKLKCLKSDNGGECDS
ncbi:putative mitochondrial protein AtMg00300 [Nicotiana tabacum]|uniref:Mitochondrial protein AtMg00300 n=1 Tax=Nicotiana tabacum TaxID=4097 RepID=A0AC58SSB7_TOBAC